MRLLLCSAVLTLATALSTAKDSWVIREDGTGPAKIGMSIEELRKVLAPTMAPNPSGYDSCYYVNFKDHPHIAFMILDERLARIDVDHRGIPDSLGIQVGDTEASALKAYGSRLKVSPHKYLDDGHYLTAKSADGGHGIRFETEKGKIIVFYAGTFEAIQYVEGCL
jgi:hypothetical protein